MPRAVSTEERQRWQDDNGDLVGFLSTVTDDEGSHFVRSMQRRVLDVGGLTDGQTRVLRTIMEERQNENAALIEGIRETVRRGDYPPRMFSPQHDPAPTVALTDDLPTIRNGVYTINDGNEHLTYRIHTVQRGSLQGKRIIKRKTSYGEFEGFGFLRTDGSLQVWRRFAEYESGNARYVVWAKHLLAALMASGTRWSESNLVIYRAPVPPPLDDEWPGIAVTEYQIQRTVHCRRCNRPLTTPSSIDGGIGPECADRESNRTVAANPTEAVADNLLTNPGFESGSEGWSATSGTNLNITISREPRTGRSSWTVYGTMRDRPSTDMCVEGDVYILSDPHNASRSHIIHVFNGYRWITMPMTYTGLSEAAAVCGQSMHTFAERIGSLTPSLQTAIREVFPSSYPGERGPAAEGSHQPGMRGPAGEREPFTRLGTRLRERPASSDCMVGDLYLIQSGNTYTGYVFDGDAWEGFVFTRSAFEQAAVCARQPLGIFSARIADLSPLLRMVVNGQVLGITTSSRRPRIRNTPQPTVRMSEIEGSDWEQ